MSGGFFRGTSADQDTRFSNKQARLLKSQKFAPELEHLVDMRKVKMDVIRPWIANRVTELLGFEDEVLINFIYGLLEAKEVNGKEVQIQLTGFMEKNTVKFMKELWALLLSAQKNESGVPQQFLDAKEEETRKKQAEVDRITSEIQKKKEKESKELEWEKLKKMDGETKASIAAVEPDSRNLLKASRDDPEDEKETNNGNGMRGRNRSSRSPQSVDRSSSSPRGSPRNSRSFSNSRSYSGSPEARRESISSERVYRSPRKRSISPRRRYPLRGSRSPARRISLYSRQRSRSSSRRRSPSPVRHRMRSPYRRRSPSPIRRRSPSPVRRRRSPSPIQRRRSPSPVRRRRSPSPIWHRRSPPIRRRRSPSTSRRRRSPSPLQRRSPSPVRRRSPLLVRRRSPSPVQHRSPSTIRRRSPSPVQRRSPSPVRRRSPSPVRRRSPPPHRRSPSPLRRRYERSPSTPHRSSLSPRRRSPAPARMRSPVSSFRRSPSPYGSSSPSLDFHKSPSPIRRSLKEYRKSTVHSPEERVSMQKKMLHQSSSSLRSPQRDAKDWKNLRGKFSSLSPSPERSHVQSESPPHIRAKDSSVERRDYKSRSSHKQSMHSSILSKQKDSPVKVQHQDDHPTERVSGHQTTDSRSRIDNMESRKRDQETKSEKGSQKRVYSGTPDGNTSPKSPGERQQVTYTGKVQTSDERDRSHSNNIKDDRSRRSETKKILVEKIDRRNGGGFDSGSDESGKRRIENKEKRKHKRSHREEVASDDGYSSDSEIEDKKEAKRRRKEEKKLRKEEKRRRREERRRRREERRAEKLKSKNLKDANSSEDEHAGRRDSYPSDGEDTQSEQKKLEIELRKKALESLKAKKGINH
ncbi:copper ion binding protein, putative [Ricinus communis]|uniref:Copper ion binding protein, putative n=1 Tax=Ricinus communis TaxID=3988 RepID=B9S3E8_RICCO|nr:copper ion binding protein, putative [Ricinus communis]